MPGGPSSFVDLARHFLGVRDDLVDHDAGETGVDFLGSEADALALIEREYVSGSCAAFAVALHDRTGWPIVGFDHGTHVAVRAPDGELVDFLGKATQASVLRRYGLHEADTHIRDWTRAEAVMAVRLDDDPELDADPWDDINLAAWVIERLGRW